VILIDATPLQSEHRFRGVGAYVRALVSHVEAAGDVLPRYLASWQDRDLIRDVLPSARTLTLPRPHRPAQVYWLYNEAFLRAALLRVQPHVFLAPDFNGLVRNPFGKTVAVLYDLTALKLNPGAPRPTGLSERLSDWRWRTYHHKLRRADHIIAISESARRDATEMLGIRPDTMTVIHLGVDHDRFRPTAGEGAFAGQPPYVLAIGGRGENKNQARILEAFSRVAGEHPGVRLYFAGPWREPDLAWLRDLNRRYRLEGRAEHLGYVADADLPSLYGNATAFVFPSLEEGFGLPVLEAMACGTPVITSTTSSLPEVAGDAALKVDPHSVDAIEAAMREVLGRPGLRAELARRGIERAAAFTWQRTARETIALLKRVSG